MPQPGTMQTPPTKSPNFLDALSTPTPYDPFGEPRWRGLTEADVRRIVAEEIDYRMQRLSILEAYARLHPDHLPKLIENGSLFSALQIDPTRKT